jgi:hypothetical protein
MAWVMAAGACIRCKKVFYFNPHLVPSVVVEGEREPLCPACVTVLSQLREQMGLTPIEVLDGAYEPLPAEEL